MLSFLSSWMQSLARKAPLSDARRRERISLADVLAATGEALSFEVQHGCDAMESRLEGVRRLLQSPSFGVDGTWQQDQVDQLAIDLLRLGLFDELAILLERRRLPVSPEIAAFVRFCQAAYDKSFEAGRAFRQKGSTGELFTLGCIVWGETYVGNFLRYNLRSLLADGNLPALRQQGRIVLHIATDAPGAELIRRDPIFEALSALATVEFTLIPSDLIAVLSRGYMSRYFYVLYGMLDHCSIYFALGADSHLFMIPVDSVVANGSLRSMADLRHEGYECCGGGNVVAASETFLSALDAKCSGKVLDITTQDLATLALEHAHQYFTSQIVAPENSDFGKHPRELFWVVPGGVAIRSIFIHPLFTTSSALRRYRRKHFANIDYGMIPRIFSAADTIKVLEDPTRAYVNNFTSASRRFESTGRSFAIADFLRSHDQTYAVQKSLFSKVQILPCRVEGWSRSDETEKLAGDIAACLGLAEGTPRTMAET